jgi:iron-sulfur cluster assembly protein
MSSVEYYQPQTVNIQISEAAKERMLKVIAATTGAVAMRLAVKKTGCSGYSYDLTPVSNINVQDLVVDIQPPFKLYVDTNSYAFLKGLIIDYVKQGLQTKFVYQNPMQTGQCGCGESFTILDK